MKEFKPRLFYVSSEGQGNMSYNANNAPGGGGPGTVNTANDGLSLFTPSTVRLGAPDGAAAAAVLLDNREIPMGGFSLKFSGIGNTITGFPIFKLDAGYLGNTPVWQVQTSTGAELCALRIHDNTSLFLGLGAGIAYAGHGGTRSVGIGALSVNNVAVPFQITAVGYQTVQNGTGGTNLTAVGTAALQNAGATANNTAVGLATLQSLSVGGGNTGVGGNVLALRTNATNNTGMGLACMGETLVATNNSIQNCGYGAACMQQQNIGNNNCGFGYSLAFNNVLLSGNSMFGANMFTAGTTVGNNNSFFGQGISSTQNIGDGNLNYGDSNTWALAAITNTGLIGRGMTVSVSNIIGLGRADQNIIIGVTAPAADNGNRVQISGKLNTGGAAPLTLGAGNMDFGKIVTAASVLNATKYWEVVVDGVLVKVCIN